MLLQSEIPKITEFGWKVTAINMWLNLHKDAAVFVSHPTDSAGYWKEFLRRNTRASRNRVLRVMKMVRERDAAGLNKAVSDYCIVPLISFGTGDGGMRSRLIQSGPSGHSKFCEGEAHAVAAVIELALRGELELLKTCPVCECLYLPSRGKQVNCSTRCSKAAYAKTPKERARRAAKSRETYARLFGTSKPRKR